MEVQAVVFDIGGVLERTPDRGVRRRWEGRLGLATGELDQRLARVWRDGSVGAISESAAEAEIRHLLGLDASQLSDFLKDIWDEYLGTPNTQMIEFFSELRPRYTTGLLSDSFVGARAREQARYGFEDLCDVIIYSHEVGMLKPDPRIYELTAGRLGVAAEEVLFLDDSDFKVEGALRAGWKAVQFRNNRQAITEIRAQLRESCSITTAPTC